MRLLVCGGRAYGDAGALAWELNRWAVQHDNLVVICGYDPDDERFQGADQLAFEWARAHGVPVFPFPAPWRKFGRSAGPRRNRRMRDWGCPEKVVAFPGGRGTADMCEAAQESGIRVHHVPASADTHPEGGDAKQAPCASMGSAVASGETPTPNPIGDNQ